MYQGNTPVICACRVFFLFWRYISPNAWNVILTTFTSNQFLRTPRHVRCIRAIRDERICLFTVAIFELQAKRNRVIPAFQINDWQSFSLNQVPRLFATPSIIVPLRKTQFATEHMQNRCAACWFNDKKSLLHEITCVGQTVLSDFLNGFCITRWRKINARW